jgi:uncharacterized membrane protein
VLFIAILLAIASLALIVTGFMGWTSRLPRNQWAGIRTKTTMTSDAVWYAAHRKAGPWLMISGVAMLIGGVLGAFYESSRSTGIAGGLIVMMSLFGVAGAATTANDAARKTLRDEVGQQQEPRT